MLDGLARLEKELLDSWRGGSRDYYGMVWLWEQHSGCAGCLDVVRDVIDTEETVRVCILGVLKLYVSSIGGSCSLTFRSHLPRLQYEDARALFLVDVLDRFENIVQPMVAQAQ